MVLAVNPALRHLPSCSPVMPLHTAGADSIERPAPRVPVPNGLGEVGRATRRSFAFRNHFWRDSASLASNVPGIETQSGVEFRKRLSIIDAPCQSASIAHQPVDR